MSDGANEMTRRLPPAWRAEKVSGGYVKLLDKLLDARLELDRPDHAHFETEVALPTATQVSRKRRRARGASRARDLKWPIQKKGSRWMGADYASILEQGAFDDLDQKNLIAAAAGRVHTALDYGQKHVDDMEDGHLHMLAALLSVIIYHHHSAGESLLVEDDDEDDAA